MGAITLQFVVTAVLLIAGSGCGLIDVLGMPTSHEKVIPPEYDLKARQDRKVLMWIECPRSSNVDYDVKEKLEAAFQIYLTERARFLPKHIVWGGAGGDSLMAQDPIEIAREQGIGYVLLVQVDHYEMVRLNIRDYYAGQMLSHAVLYDVDLGMAVWPQNAAAKVVHVEADLETKGRATALSRLVSAMAHCTMRSLYPCEKPKFKIRDEKVTIQDAYGMDTF